MVLSTSCSCRETGFDFQHLNDNTQPSIIPVLRHMMPLAFAGIRHGHNIHTNIPAKYFLQINILFKVDILLEFSSPILDKTVI